MIATSTTMLWLYTTAALLASLAGGGLALLFRLNHTRIQTALSFVAGLMLGMALLHLIPHAASETRSLDHTVRWALAGFLVMFFLQRLFHYHRHDLPDAEPENGHGHAPNHDGAPAASGPTRIAWLGTALGLGFHSILDGLALAAAVAAESKGGSFVGLGTALAVILHKPFDAMTVTMLMRAGRSSRRSRWLVNGIFALITPLGVALSALGMGGIAETNQAVLGGMLAFCAGSFLCISCSDLLPELHFHTHDRLRLSLALLAGLGVSILVGAFEGDEHGHAHEALETTPRRPPSEN